MPVVEQKVGSCYIWTVAAFLFISVATGGVFLALYMSEPEDPNTRWYPYAGVTLVCLPWLFWILTILYRILSRAFGFRMACWGVSPTNDDAVAVSVAGAPTSQTGALMEAGTRAGSSSTRTGGDDGGRKVHFAGDLQAVGEEPDDKNELSSSVRSTDSHDSEAPLRHSMAS